MGTGHKQKKHFPNLRVVIAGGVTGGHLFPGIAVAQEVMARNPDNRVLFVSVGNPLECRALAECGFELGSISVSGIKGRGVMKQVSSMLGLPRSIFSAMRHLTGFRPDLVVGMGGFSAGPVAVGAWLMRRPLVICEQNILPGITNRILSRIASRIYVSFEKSLGEFNPGKARFSGNPVRREFRKKPEEQKAAGPEDTHALGRFTICVVGGSQGAHAINMAVTEALDHLPDKARFFFVHQTGVNDVEMVKRAYTEKGVDADVRAFIGDMAGRYAASDLVICRSGATTVAEISALGKTAIFIPFPHATDNHQVLNAQSMVDAGAAEMILERVLEGKLLARRIVHYAAHPEIVSEMGRLARGHGNPDAAAYIVDDCFSLLGIFPEERTGN